MSNPNDSSNKASKALQGIRGMPDVLPTETPAFLQFEALWKQLMGQYGYEEIRLPILESTRLFQRSIGEVTDIVEKEMFTFSDRDGESVTLRPEGTAGCIRAGLEHGLFYNQTQRLWYSGPMFRYERPQKGRYRQFYQVGVEALGFEGPDVDVEQISMIARLWKKLGISEGVTLEVNSLGSADARKKYREALVAYFTEYYDQLDEDCKRRLKTNPLRILDSKNPDLKEIIQKAPQGLEFLGPADRIHFDQFLAYLNALKIPYKINSRLVRGLDYYNRTVYEWVTDRLGAQGTVCAGGRYDGLVEELGGKPTPGVGFALGVERVLLLQQTFNLTVQNRLDVYCIYQSENVFPYLFAAVEDLRTECPSLNILMHCGGGSFKNQFKKADKSGAEIALILGEAEWDQKIFGVKFLRKEQPQITVPMAEMGTWLNNFFHEQLKDERSNL